MKHYMQYHKIHELGRPISVDGDFKAYTKKSVTDSFIGQMIWLVSGEKQGDRTAYLLEYAFVVDSVERGIDGISTFRGSRGFMPRRPAPVRLAPWFVEMQKKTRNFQNGLSLIPVELIQEIADAFGWPDGVLGS
jgi:hypothetical protein